MSEGMAPGPDGAAAAAAPVEHRFEFTGQAGELFRIWIVNLCLTVLTLGLYSPWAKVRTRRYLYGHLRLDGSGFEYTADPKRILIGRLIALAIFGLYTLAGQFSPFLTVPVGVGMAVAYPWLAVQSAAFHHKNTRYRGVRFGFAARYGEAARVYLGWAVLSVLSFGLALPYWQGRRQQFQVEHSRYGASPFAFAWRGGPYYSTYLGAAAATGAAAAFPFLLGVFGGMALSQLPEGAVPPGAGSAALTMLVVLGYLGALAAFQAVVGAGLGNLLFAGARLGEHRFRGALRARELGRLYFSSGAAVLLSLGLLFPWARVRVARYRAEHTSLLAAGDLGAFAQEADAAAGGEFASEAADVLDFGFDFGL
jgi:uncharacterized membrane protein YjgN (DUF898 family)